jgi:hypothetical protein
MAWEKCRESGTELQHLPYFPGKSPLVTVALPGNGAMLLPLLYGEVVLVVTGSKRSGISAER